MDTGELSHPDNEGLIIEDLRKREKLITPGKRIRDPKFGYRMSIALAFGRFVESTSIVDHVHR